MCLLFFKLCNDHNIFKNCIFLNIFKKVIIFKRNYYKPLKIISFYAIK